jgi:hypothetical protein
VARDTTLHEPRRKEWRWEDRVTHLSQQGQDALVVVTRGEETVDAVRAELSSLWEHKLVSAPADCQAVARGVAKRRNVYVDLGTGFRTLAANHPSLRSELGGCADYDLSEEFVLLDRHFEPLDKL